MSYTTEYIAEASQILTRLDTATIDRMVALLGELRERGGRLFFLGVGGSAANASHAVNDFRKIAQIEAYSPTDNVSELTARVNDESWESVFVSWLRGSRLTARDMVFVLSVGGGDLERNISPNLVRALEYARSIDATICGIVGRIPAGQRRPGRAAGWRTRGAGAAAAARLAADRGHQPARCRARQPDARSSRADQPAPGRAAAALRDLHLLPRQSGWLRLP